MTKQDPFCRLPLTIKEALKFSKDRTPKYFKCIKIKQHQDIFFTIGKVYKTRNQLVGTFFTSRKGYFIQTDEPSRPEKLVNADELIGYFELVERRYLNVITRSS